MEQFVIQPCGGFANHLRVLFTYRKVLQRENIHLIFIWRPTSQCPGTFLDYFEPLEGVTFVSDYKTNYVPDYEGCFCHPEFAHPDGDFPNTFIYEDLKLNAKMQQKVQNVLSTLQENFNAVHMRRTDHIDLAKNWNVFVSDNEFIKYCEMHQNNDIYIATDNRSSQKMLENLFPRAIKYYDEISTHRTGHRFTNLEHTVIDAFVCIEAANFMGTPRSSLTEFIQQFRDYKRK